MEIKKLESLLQSSQLHKKTAIDLSHRCYRYVFITVDRHVIILITNISPSK